MPQAHLFFFFSPLRFQIVKEKAKSNLGMRQGVAGSYQATEISWTEN